MKSGVKDEAYKDYLQGKPYPAIAEKYGVSLSTVKSWAARHWNKNATAKPKKTATASVTAVEEKAATDKGKPRGRPFGNQNAKGNKGGSPPKHNANAVKTGVYQSFFEDCLSDDEREFMNSELPSPLEQIEHEIKICNVSIRRMMKHRDELIKQRQADTPNKMSELTDTDLADNVTKIIENREGKGKSSQVIIDRRILEKILSIEEAITRARKQLLRAIEARNKILQEENKSGEMNGETADDVVIYLPEKEPEA